jgi:D-glycero-D-manno-heptose 1,7-bisphosphate phosphatase
MTRRAVFLDRDGTLNVERGYLRDVDQLELMPGVAHAIKRLNTAGWLAILVTNQSGPARGFYGEDHVLALNQRLAHLLKTEADAYLDAIFYCPHLPANKPNLPPTPYAVDCTCRKPLPGMIEQASAQFGDIDLPTSYMVGDKASDVELAHNAGCKGILLTTGYGQRVVAGQYQSLDHTPHAVCDSLHDAVALVLAEATV